MTIECGIHSWGAAIPRRRLLNAETEKAWNRAAIAGERSIAGHDEDAITLAVEAGIEALEKAAIAGSAIDALMFASTTAPFAEKSSATIIADTLGLRPDVLCLDFTASIRAGTIALETALHFIRGGELRYVLVVAGDTRLPEPGAADEFLSAHAGAALLVGRADGARAKVIAETRFQSSLVDTWRGAKSDFFESGDLRFNRTQGYAAALQAVLTDIQKKTGLTNETINRVVLYSPDLKSGMNFLKKNGFDVKSKYFDLVSPKIGLSGTAHTMLMLGSALEKSAPGERLLALDYGDGAGAIVFEVLASAKSAPVQEKLKQGYHISYNDYLRIRGLYQKLDSRENMFSSEIMNERNKVLWRGLTARRCLTCSTVQTLPLPVCPHCKKPTDFSECKLQRTGTVFSITHEHYFPTPEPPLGMAIVELDGGGRMTIQVADENQPLKIDDRVELVFRRLHEARGIPQYFWKCRSIPVRLQTGKA